MRAPALAGDDAEEEGVHCAVPRTQNVGWAKAHLRRAHHLPSATPGGGHVVGRASARPPPLPTLRCRAPQRVRDTANSHIRESRRALFQIGADGFALVRRAHEFLLLHRFRQQCRARIGAEIVEHALAARIASGLLPAISRATCMASLCGSSQILVARPYCSASTAEKIR